LKGTCDEKLTFRKAGDSNDGRSCSGFLFMLAGGAISWGSLKQKCVALSSTESEYIALSEGARESVYLTHLLSELTGKRKTVQLYSDNQSAVKLCYNLVFHNRTNHIDIRYHYTRELVENKCITVNYLPSEEMSADILTKSLNKVKHKFKADLGLE
jgi:hypothetical protein